MAFKEGDLVGAVDGYGRSVSGVATSSGIGGWVMLQPSDRNDGGVWVTPPAVLVRASSCSVIEPLSTRLQNQAIRDQEHAGRQATRAVEQRLRERARDDGER